MSSLLLLFHLFAINSLDALICLLQPKKSKYASEKKCASLCRRNSHILGRERRAHTHTLHTAAVVFIFSKAISNHFVFNLVLQREEGGTDCTDKRKGKMRREKERDRFKWVNSHTHMCVVVRSVISHMNFNNRNSPMNKSYSVFSAISHCLFRLLLSVNNNNKYVCSNCQHMDNEKWMKTERRKRHNIIILI